MKGLLIGCGVILAIVIIAVVVIGYFGVQTFKNVGEQVDNMKDNFAGLNALYPFEEPSDGLIASDRYEIWLTVRDSMLTSVAAYDTIVKHFSLKSVGRLKDHTFMSMQRIGRQFRETGMSPKEYIWISRQMAGAFASGDLRARPEFSDLVQAYDELEKDDENIKRDYDFKDFSTPVTSLQIKRIMTLLAKNPDRCQQSMKVFYMDMIISSMADEMKFQEKKSDSDVA
jgi:hypothetical protein